MTNEYERMNGDPRCCPRGRGDCVVSLVNLTADVPDSSSSGLGAFQQEWQGRGTNTARNMWGYSGGGSFKCCWNAPGMLDRAFRRRPVQPRQMWPWGKSQDRHSKSGLYLFSSMPTFQWNILGSMEIGGWLMLN